MHVISSRFLLVGLFILPAGCANRKDAGTPGGPASLLEFCNSFVRAVSRMDARCMGGTEAYWSKVFSEGSYCEIISERVAAGLLAYHPNKAAACLSFIDGPDACSADLGALPPACEPALSGTIPAGQACRVGSFPGCVPGARAMLNPREPSCSCICKMTGSCGGGESCNTGSACVDGTCVPDAREGQSCDNDSGPKCPRNLRCVGSESGTSRTCRAIENSGPCWSYDDCGDGLYGCMGPKDARICSRWKFPGDSCTPGQEECLPVLYCGADGKCTDAEATENQACGTNGQGETIRCASGLYCKGGMHTMGTCVSHKSPGDSCSEGTECGYPEGDCDPLTYQCVTCTWD